MVPSLPLELEQILNFVLGVSSVDLKVSKAYTTLILGRSLPGSRGGLNNLFALSLGFGGRKLLVESTSVGRIHIVK